MAPGNYELAVVEFDGTNFRLLQATPASAAAIGLTGSTCIAKWSFPAVSSYAAGQTDCGTVLSNYNTPISSLTVTLPSTSAIAAGWRAVQLDRCGQARSGAIQTLAEL